MVAECPGYSVVRQRHSALFGCLGGLDGLLTRVVTSEQFRASRSHRQGLVQRGVAGHGFKESPCLLLEMNRKRIVKHVFRSHVAQDQPETEEENRGTAQSLGVY